MSISPPKSAAPATIPNARDILRWHAGWAGGIILAGLALSFASRQDLAIPARALAIGLAPALGAWGLNWRDSALGRDWLQVAWAVCGGLACALTGGLSGPLVIWCLTPMVTAVVVGGARRLSQGAVLSVLVVTVVGLSQLDRLVAEAPHGAAALGLGLIGVASTGLGLAVALLSAHRQARIVGESRAFAAAEALDLLDRQPYRIITLDDCGRIDGVFGDPMRFLLPAEALIEGGLLSIADESDRAALDAALGTAIVSGRAGLAFRGAPPRRTWLTIELQRLSPSRLIAVLRDATAERAHLDAVEAARADAEALNIGKSRFLANMSHELRTPLNAIMGFSDVMRQRIFGALPSRYAEYADLIHDAGSHLLDLINDVLDMSKIEAAKYELSLERLDAREPVQAALRLMRVQADDVGVQLRGALPNDALDMDADRRALKQIALNLISNALKFTPAGGLVTVSLNSVAGALELVVADTGVGIAAEDLKRLGRPYEQAGDAMQQGRGTGLGLSLVRSFAELHGGEMIIESRLGEGTAVTVRLPMLASQPEDGGVTAPALAAPVSAAR